MLSKRFLMLPVLSSAVELVREYTRRVFNEHNPELAAEFVTPDVKWHGLREEWVCEGADQVIDTFAGERDAKREIDAIELLGTELIPQLEADGVDVDAQVSAT